MGKRPRRGRQPSMRWAEVADAGDGILVSVRCSKTNQDGETNDVRYLKDGAAVDAPGVRRLSGLFGGECCHLGNSHSAYSAQDYGPAKDTVQGYPLISTANRARCTVARPRRSAR